MPFENFFPIAPTRLCPNVHPLVVTQGGFLTDLRLGVKYSQYDAEVAQLVEHAAENRGVSSPILLLGTIVN